MTTAHWLGLLILAAMTAALLYHEAGRMVSRHVEAALNRRDDREHPARYTDLPQFDAAIRAMPVTEAALVVQGWLLDGDVGAEAEAWLAERGGAS